MPGRVRIRFGSRAGFASAHEDLSGRLGSTPGVKAVEVKPLSRSLVVHHEPEYPDMWATIEGILGEVGVILEGDEFPAYEVPGLTNVGQSIVGAVSSANKRIGRATGGHLDLRDVFPLTLFGIGVWEIVRGRAARMPWYNLVFYGYTIFYTLHTRREAKGPSAIEMLRQRYVKGEITRAQYRTRLKEIGGESETQTASA
jgi:hypothetical protein